MTPAGGEPRPRGLALRAVVASLALAHAVVFLAAAWTLPWRGGGLFSGLAVGVGLQWLGVAVTAASLARWWERVWAVAAVSTLGLFCWVSWVLGTGALYLSRLYVGLGNGVALALGGVWAALGLFCLPLAIWGIARVFPSLSKRARAGGAGGGVLLVGLAAASSFLSAGGAALPAGETQPSAAAVSEALREALAVSPRAGGVATGSTAPSGTPDRPWRSFFSPLPTACAEPPGAGRWTLVVSFHRDAALRSTCLQASAPAALLGELRRAVTGADPGPVKLDLLRSAQSLGPGPGFLDDLKLRPGLDGACLGARCLMPWQLLASEAFSSHRPLSFIPDLQFGHSPEQLSARLGGSPADLVRVTTASWLWTEDGRLLELTRLRLAQVEVSPAALRGAELAAEAHLVEAQGETGLFRYSLHPFTGQEDRVRVNLARHAGATLALCQLAQDSEGTRQAMRRALAVFERKARVLGDAAFLSASGTSTQVSLTEVTLPLAALVACRARVGDHHDPLIGRLARGLLQMQDAHGRFASAYDLERQVRVQRGDALYGAGQAILALGSLEGIAAESPGAFPPADVLRDAVTRAMHHVSREYWPDSLRDFFFLEENWHCIAAQALLTTHRDPDYEQFCLDTVQFKSRLILERDVAPDFVGGFGFGNVIPPHNTGTAGFAEALAAALFVKQARGEPLASDQERLRKVLGFLLRQQWTRDTCFACGSRQAIGAMSEHAHSAVSRIDYVQHLWAGLAQGRRALALEEAGAAGEPGS